MRLTKHLASVVTKAFAKLDKRDGENLPRNLARDTAECLEVLLSGLFSDQIGLELNWSRVDVLAESRRRVALLTSKSLLLPNLVERGGNLGHVAESHIDLVGTGGGSHDKGVLSSVGVHT